MLIKKDDLSSSYFERVGEINDVATTFLEASTLGESIVEF